MKDNMKNTLSDIIDSAYKIQNGIKERIVTNKELDEFFALKIKETYSLLEEDKNSVVYKKFDNWKQTKYLRTSRTRPWYAEPKDGLKIIDLIEILKEISGYEKIEDEEIFEKEDEYEAKRYMLKLVQKAKENILIIDNFLDDSIFNYIDWINDNITINLLTTETKDIFRSLFSSIQKKRNNIMAKTIDKSENHGRYIIIDKTEVYESWTSINGIWKHRFVIKKLNNLDLITRLYESRNKWTLLK